MKNLFILLFLFNFINTYGQAEEKEKKVKTQLGVELQGYPTGLISGLRSEHIFNNKNALNLKVGYNFLNHRDLGKHASEKGGGFGFSIGWRRFFEEEGLKGFFIGARSDLWFNKVDWEDYAFGSLTAAGTSNIVVLQPTIEAGYKIKFANDWLSFEPSVAFGIEWNVKTDGTFTFLDFSDIGISDEIFKTGEGLVVLLGFSFMIALNK